MLTTPQGRPRPIPTDDNAPLCDHATVTLDPAGLAHDDGHHIRRPLHFNVRCFRKRANGRSGYPFWYGPSGYYTLTPFVPMMRAEGDVMILPRVINSYS